MKNRAMLDPNDVVLLLIDHQTGLFQTVKDLDVGELHRNVVGLAKFARLVKIPVITTASVPDGPNGPLISELGEILPDAVYVPRHGQINAWDNPDFVKAVKETKRNTLVMAGTLSNVCLAFPAISAAAEGYRVYGLMDASGCWSAFSKDLALARMTHAGVIPTDCLALMAEVQQTWARPDAAEFAELYAEFMPSYRLLMESHARAGQAAKAGAADPDSTTSLKKSYKK